MNSHELTNIAVARVSKSAPAEWYVEGLEAIIVCANTYKTFTTSQVYEFIQPPVGVDPRVMGALMVKARNLGLIKKTGAYRNIEREGCHSSPLRVWKGA